MAAEQAWSRRAKRPVPHEVDDLQGNKRKKLGLHDNEALTTRELNGCQEGTSRPRGGTNLLPVSVALLEGEISPKNFRQPPHYDLRQSGVSPSADDLLSRPPRRKRPRRFPGLPTNNLTRASVEALLPGSAFGHASHVVEAGLWSVMDELSLRQSWSLADESALLAPDAEIIAWRAMTDRFGCPPPDLFRYGLRYRPASPAANEAFWRGMLRLLPHRFWGGDPAVLRYALQLAVMHRLRSSPGHVEPLTPPWQGAEPAFVSWLRGLRPRGWDSSAEMAEVAQFRSTAQIVNRSGMRELDEMMAHCGPRGTGEPRPAFERFLFMVEMGDLALIADALDAMYLGLHEDDGEAMVGRGAQPPVLAADFFRIYWRQLPVQLAQATEADRTRLLEQKRLAVVAERREALIRHRMHAAGVRNLYLPDVPPSDPATDFRLYRKITAGQLLVVRGQCAPPDTSRWVKGYLCTDADGLMMEAHQTMSRELGMPYRAAAGDLAARARERLAEELAVSGRGDPRLDVAGLLFSTHVIGWPTPPPVMLSELV